MKQEQEKQFWDRVFAFAKKEGVEYITYYMWKKRQSIPYKWHAKFLIAGEFTAEELAPYAHDA